VGGNVALKDAYWLNQVAAQCRHRAGQRRGETGAQRVRAREL